MFAEDMDRFDYVVVGAGSAGFVIGAVVRAGRAGRSSLCRSFDGGAVPVAEFGGCLVGGLRERQQRCIRVPG
jgi:hypothetical protein